jgi:signal recognition particle receptor subunit beta
MAPLANRNHTIQLVYCGPLGSGKTTNLRRLAARLPDRFRSRLLVVDSPVGTCDYALDRTERGSTHFVDLLPIVLDIEGGPLKLRLLAVPGHYMYEPTRRLLLRSADGVIFVADSTLSLAENQQSFADLRSSLRENGRAPDSMPLVIQLNKTDLDGQQRIGLRQAQSLSSGRTDVEVIPASAEHGAGVVETLLQLMRLLWPAVLHDRESLAALALDLPQLLELLRQRLQVGEPGQRQELLP